jgi:Zn-dependent metalloprotease
VVVSDAAARVLSESASDRRNGLGTGSKLGPQYANFDVTPTFSAETAISLVLKSITKAPVHALQPNAELIIYPVLQQVRVAAAADKDESELNAMDLADEVTGYELSYLVKTRLVIGGRPVYRDTIVSARDGHVVKQWNALKTEIGVGNSQYNGRVPISTTLSNGIYSMKDPLRGVNGRFGVNAVTNARGRDVPGPVYTNRTNTWGDGQQYRRGSTTNANGQTAAVNALWGLMNTYDTLNNVLGWKSLDGYNTATYINVHVYNNYDNAFYDDVCQCMYIGDGGDYFYSLSSVDVIAHEMGHGVTAATSNLTYDGESGGLNESASDINGEMAEAYTRNGSTGKVIPATGNDWLLGKEISRNGLPLRWMAKPSKDGTSPDAWSRLIGMLDVHYSSGPNNRMFYFLAQGSSADLGSDTYSRFLTRSPRAMTGIGNDKAYRVWFRALTTKFTSSTNYADARNKVLQAAQELYGANSKEAIAVQRAYAAINVGADIDEAPSATTSQ